MMLKNILENQQRLFIICENIHKCIYIWMKDLYKIFLENFD